MEPPPKKRFKSSDERSLELMSFGRASFVSKSGIANLLNTFKKEGLPATYDRSAQFRARKQVCQTMTPYGKLVVTIPVVFPDGKEGEIACQNPLAFLYYNCQKSSHYAEIVRESLERHPCGPATPWELIIYQDGVDPSDGLSSNHSGSLVCGIGVFSNLVFGIWHVKKCGAQCV